MKQIIVLLIFITTFGSAGSGRNPGGESAISDDDSILVASGYEVVELAKLRTGHRQGLLRQASHVKYSSKRSDYLRFNIIFAMPLTILLVLFCSTKISENPGMA